MLLLLGLIVGASFGVVVMGFVQGCEKLKYEPRCRCRGAHKMKMISFNAIAKHARITLIIVNKL